ncbi:hypothetical protein AQUCO_01700572v1 [Aquilegia coerulea]|uniref:Uncharacterized protein n=1 Tax=Aquilegia coerulea TaxID=218851 RepID=A0A2G5DNP3_AQUCA|nr:hypothetical protein AQUCO_01700572v1 [Aquilegia coerulea]
MGHVHRCFCLSGGSDTTYKRDWHHMLHLPTVPTKIDHFHYLPSFQLRLVCLVFLNQEATNGTFHSCLIL